MDEIHFMRKKADIKRANNTFTDQIKAELRNKSWSFPHIFYPELASTPHHLKNIPCKIDIFISTNENSIETL